MAGIPTSAVLGGFAQQLGTFALGSVGFPGAAPTTGTLTLVKVVDGGTALITDWTLSADGPTPISGAGGVGPSSVNIGTYGLSESGGPGVTWDSLTGTWDSNTNTWDGVYSQGVWVCVGGSQIDDSTVIIGDGQVVVCTITNTFNPAPPPLCPTIYVLVVDPPDPPAAATAPLTCAAPPVPGYTPIATIYDEPSERTGS